MNLSKQTKQDFWKNHIARALKREMGARAYCRDNDLDPLQFYYWRNKFRQAKARSTPQALMPTFAPVSIAPEAVEIHRSPGRLPDAEWVGRFAVELIRGLSR